MKRKLASLRLTSLILAVFFLLHALRNSSAHAHQAKAAGTFETTILKEEFALSQKEPLDATSTTNLAKANKKATGGRKLKISHETEQEDDQGVMKNHDSMLSGILKRYALENSSERTLGGSLNNQMEEKMVGKPRSSNPDSTKLNKQVALDEESKARKDESKRIFEAEKEIMKLMRRDYGGGWKPRRKPPINNHTPKN